MRPLHFCNTPNQNFTVFLRTPQLLNQENAQGALIIDSIDHTVGRVGLLQASHVIRMTGKRAVAPLHYLRSPGSLKTGAFRSSVIECLKQLIRLFDCSGCSKDTDRIAVRYGRQNLPSHDCITGTTIRVGCIKNQLDARIFGNLFNRVLGKFSEYALPPGTRARYRINRAHCRKIHIA